MTAMTTPFDSPGPFPCPRCGTLIVYEPSATGTLMHCPECQAEYPIPPMHPVSTGESPLDLEQAPPPPARRKRHSVRAEWPDEDDRVRRPRGSSRKIWVLVLSLGGGLLLLCGLSCGGLVFWMANMFRELPAVQVGADAFLDDLRAQHVAEAYARTDKAFQSKQSLEQFRAWVKQYPALTSNTSRSYTGLNIYQQPGGTQGIVKATVLGPNNSLSFTLILAKENEQWKIHSITVP